MCFPPAFCFAGSVHMIPIMDTGITAHASGGHLSTCYCAREEFVCCQPHQGLSKLQDERTNGVVGDGQTVHQNSETNTTRPDQIRIAAPQNSLEKELSMFQIYHTHRGGRPVYYLCPEKNAVPAKVIHV